MFVCFIVSLIDFMIYIYPEYIISYLRVWSFITYDFLYSMEFQTINGSTKMDYFVLFSI